MNIVDTIDDDLEFTVTFPTPSLHPCSKVPDADPNCEPVVFILGWEGARDEDMLSHTRMYEAWGCISIRYTSPARWVYLHADQELRDTARRLAALLTELCLTDNPVIVHCLSNNATNMYLHLKQVASHILESHSNNINIQMLPESNKLVGVIFEGVKRRTMMETVIGIWNSAQSPEKSLLNIIISLLWFIFYLVVSCFVRNSSEDTIASEASPPALFLVAKDSKLPFHQDDIFNARQHLRRKVKDDSDDRFREFECGDFKEMISNFPDDYPQSILDFVQSRLTEN